MSFFSDLNRFAKSRARYLEYSNNEQLRQHTVYFGVCSIVESIISIVLAFTTYFCIDLYTQENIVIKLLGLLFGIAFGISTIIIFICALVNMIRQLKMNHRVVGKVAIGFFVLAIVGIILSISLFFLL